jgi:hypothetical protein
MPLPVATHADSPYGLVTQHFQFPFEFRPYQIEAVNELGPIPASALWWKPGLGKTAGSTAIGLYKILTGEADQIVVIIPPILHATWKSWLSKVRYADGTPVGVTSYRGTPSERAALRLDRLFTVVGIQIFKKDYARFYELSNQQRLHTALDESAGGASIKNVGSDNYKKYREFVSPGSNQLLSGTPITASPEDGYAACKLKSPSIYRNLNQFLRIHAVEKDFFNKVTEWGNLDLLAENMGVNAKFASKEEHLKDLPPKIISTLEYDLDKQHLKLYRKMVEEQLLKLPDNKKIDLTQATALYHAMGQVVLGWDHFAGDDTKVAEGWNVLEEVMDELGDGKLMVFATYRRTNAAIVARYAEKYGAVSVYGDISTKQKEANVARFTHDPACRLITIQVRSAQGLDGMQEACSDCLFIEPPTLPAHAEQALSRLHRSGQTKPVTVRIAIARGTIQQRLLANLLENEGLLNPLIRTPAELRAALLGE